MRVLRHLAPTMHLLERFCALYIGESSPGTQPNAKMTQSLEKTVFDRFTFRCLLRGVLSLPNCLECNELAKDYVFL